MEETLLLPRASYPSWEPCGQCGGRRPGLGSALQPAPFLGLWACGSQCVPHLLWRSPPGLAGEGGCWANLLMWSCGRPVHTWEGLCASTALFPGVGVEGELWAVFCLLQSSPSGKDREVGGKGGRWVSGERLPSKCLEEHGAPSAGGGGGSDVCKHRPSWASGPLPPLLPRGLGQQAGPPEPVLIPHSKGVCAAPLPSVRLFVHPSPHLRCPRCTRVTGARGNEGCREVGIPR